MTVPPHFWREILVKSRQESTNERASFRPIIEFFVAVTHLSAGYRKIELVEVVTHHTMVRFDRNTTELAAEYEEALKISYTESIKYALRDFELHSRVTFDQTVKWFYEDDEQTKAYNDIWPDVPRKTIIELYDVRNVA
ncbi:hypothetical protein DFH06DRAFT_1131456 [Mycena polygramma]|nr:hypothetical protein DFH06DRAFT_1131456 [Mycena polygramma]